MSLWGDYLKDLLDVSFNGASLQEISGAQVTDHNFDEMPEIKSSRNPISAAHRSVTTGSRFITKRATVNLAVRGEDLHNLQAILGRIRQLTQYANRDVVLTFGVPINNAGDYDLDETRTVTFKNANLVAADMNHNAAKGTVITVEFMIDDPIGIGGTPQTIYSTTGRTAALTSIDLSALDLQGTFQEQYPTFEITINSVTNGSTPSIEIENGLNILTISQSFTAADVILIDTDPETMSVKINGEMVDLSGSFPFIADPNSIIYIRDTLSARNIDIEVSNNPRYI